MDHQLFTARAKQLGADVTLQVTSCADAAKGIREGSLRVQGIDALVLVSSNDGHALEVVEAAHGAGVPVVAYDKLIEDCELDLFVSFDNLKVGILQASYLTKRVPHGKYVLIGGPPEDANAKSYRLGQMAILQPFLDRGDIQIVADEAAKGWFPMEAFRITKAALEKTGGKIDAVLASNDGTAGGALQALTGKGLAGKVPVTGQDADLAACRRIVQGIQSMTVYKPVTLLAARAAEATVALCMKEPFPGKIQVIPNGNRSVPSLLYEPITVDLDNLRATVIKDGFHVEAEVFVAP